LMQNWLFWVFGASFSVISRSSVGGSRSLGGGRETAH